jgi:heme exporter protein C
MASAPASSLSASLTGLANPTRFMDLSGRILPWLGGLTAILLVFGLWLAFFVAPADYQQGNTARIMFIHVPSAWLSLFLYTMMAVSALGTLVWRHPLADVAQKAAAPLGAAFAFLCLVTGSLWGKPMWGTYWVWDARLTSMLVLFLMYCGILALWRTIEEPGRAARAVAILTLVGVINIPIVKFSVDWWSTLHQPAGVLKLTGSTVDPSIRWPLLEMAIAFTLLALTLHLVGMRTEIMRRRVRTLTILAAECAEREAA